jgi:hypothetical protein
MESWENRFNCGTQHRESAAPKKLKKRAGRALQKDVVSGDNSTRRWGKDDAANVQTPSSSFVRDGKSYVTCCSSMIS